VAAHFVRALRRGRWRRNARRCAIAHRVAESRPTGRRRPKIAARLTRYAAGERNKRDKIVVGRRFLSVEEIRPSPALSARVG
jgi:hypothetical protein